MGKFKIIKSEIEGVFTVEPTVFGDERGYFMETYNENDFKEEGIDLTFVQDNQSKSSKGVLSTAFLRSTALAAFIFNTLSLRENSFV